MPSTSTDTSSYYWITEGFQSTSGSLANLVNGLDTMKSACEDTTLLGSFIENHDIGRFASLTPDFSLAKNALAATLLADGIPIIYAGQEQHYAGNNTPYSREATWYSKYNTDAVLYQHIKALNSVRSLALKNDPEYLTYKAVPTQPEKQSVVLRKGHAGKQIVALLTNKGQDGNKYELTLAPGHTEFGANEAVVEVLGCTELTTDGGGNLRVQMSGGLPRVFYPKERMGGSGVCPDITGA